MTITEKSKKSRTILSWAAVFLLSIVLTYYLYQCSFSWIIYTAAGILLTSVIFGWLVYGRNKWVDLVLDLTFATALSLFLWHSYCGIFFDDAGFELRYLDNFRDGYFFTYNKTDGPVFGISSPLQGMLNGLLCRLHIFTPEQAIRRTAYAGFLALCFLVIRILRSFSFNRTSVLMFSVLVITSSKMVEGAAKSGLEAPIHTAIILAACYFFLVKSPRWMWAFLALAVFSKLDAVPFAVVTGLMFLFENRKSIRPISFKNPIIRYPIIFAAIPLTIWIIFATLVFGSPLPQSAYSKIHFHGHGDDYWFPFFTRYAKDAYFLPLIIIFGVLFIIHFIIAYRKRDATGFRSLVFGFSFVGTMVLYYFYNPGEKMMWYYFMPDILLLLQIVVSAYYIIEKSAVQISKPVIAGFFFSAFFVFIIPDVYGGKFWIDRYLSAVDYERDQIGIYMGNVSSSNDTVMTFHGQPARHVKGYALDMSGLNCKLATQYLRDDHVIIEKFHPAWAVSHWDDDQLSYLQSQRYTLDRSFYDITEYGWHCWRLMRHLKPGEKGEYLILAKQPNVVGGNFAEVESNCFINGKSVSLVFHDSSAVINRLVCGMKREEQPYDLKIVMRFEDSTGIKTDSTIIRIPGQVRIRPDDALFTHAIDWRLPITVTQGSEVNFTFRKNKSEGEVILIDPGATLTW